MNNLLFSPPVAFLIVLFVIYLLGLLFSKISYRPQKQEQGSGEAYACGEDSYDSSAQPDYSVFFPFAFFFTLAHVGTLIIMTVTLTNFQSFNLALLYILGIVVGLSILLRK
jgi:NADH:ubiquinone oxidoreductase subunit 3 (subunit A)